MTVKELRKILADMPQSAQVLVANDPQAVAEIASIYVAPDGMVWVDVIALD